MKKIIPLLMASFLLAMSISTQAQLLAIKIINTVNPTCSYDSNGSANVVVSGGVAPYTYLWEPSGQTTDSAVGLKAAVPYTLTVTDYASDSIIEYFTLTSSSTLVASTSSAEVSCFGMSNGMASVLPTGGMLPYQYLWQPVAQTTDTANALAAGTYTSQVTDANGCVVRTPATVAQPPILLLTASRIDSLAIVYASGGTVPYTFSWSPGGYTSDTVSGLHAGTYTVTVTDAKLCSNIAVVNVTGAELYLSLGDTSVTCGNPSYFSFDVLISSDSVKRLNDCEFHLNIPQSEFAGDVLFNGIEIEQGPNFQYDSGANDYQMILSQSDSVLDIATGSWGFKSPLGTIVDTTPEVLFHITLKITNSCGTGAVAFNQSYFSESHYVYEDSTFLHKDSIALDSICCPNFHCPYQCDSFPCNLHCCNYDIDSNCLDSCYDVCWHTCYDTCYDTFKIVHYLNVYSYTYIANIEYLSTSFSAPIPTSSCSPYIALSTNPVMAGTNGKSAPANSSIDAISGWGFGAKKGRMLVSDANSDSTLSITLDSMDILYWSENLIKIKMPSLVFNNIGRTPGSGPFELFNGCGQLAASHYGTDIQINYSILNYDSINSSIHEKLRPNIVMVNPSESFNIVCDTSIWNNKPALGCVKKAIQTWNCYTGVDWKLSNDSTMAIDTSQPDKISAIYFGSFPLYDSAVAMQTKPWYNSCNNLPDSIAFKDEADIKIKRQQYFPYHYRWDYDTTGVIDTGRVIYFYDIILHELGHVHGLNHTNDPLSLMYWYTPPAPLFRPDILSYSTYPGPATLLGALDMVNTSAANSPSLFGCGSYSILVPSFRYCIDPTLGIPVIPDNPYNLVLFPNPINRSDINIAYQLTKNSTVQLKIEDAIGRVVLKLKDEQEPPGTYGEKINIDVLAAGVYLFTANINGEVQTIKFIKI